MAISKNVQEAYQKLKDKYLRKPESPDERRRRITLKQEIMGYSAILFIIALAMALGITVAAIFAKKPQELNKIYRAEFTEVYGFEKRIDLGEYLECANQVHGGQEMTRNIYETWKNQQAPKPLFDCARNLDEARSLAERGDLTGAREMLRAAQLNWAKARQKLGSSDAVQMLENQMINTRQKVIEEAAVYELARAEALFEVITDNYLPGLTGRTPEMKSEHVMELVALQSYLKQLKEATSTQDQTLIRQFSETIAKIANALEQLKTAK